MKSHLKMEKAIIKFGDIEIEKQKFHQFKRLISYTDIDKIVVSNKASFCIKKTLNISLSIKKLKNTSFFQKSVHMEKTSMKLNICLF